MTVSGNQGSVARQRLFLEMARKSEKNKHATDCYQALAILIINEGSL